MKTMTTWKMLFGLGALAALLPLDRALAQPPPIERIEPEEPLTIPTPGGPKLRLPEIAPPPPSLMLDQIRPLTVPPRDSVPTLNRFPGVEAETSSDEEVPDSEGEPRLRLQH